MCQRNQWSLKIYQAQRLLQNKRSLSMSFNGGSLYLYPRHLMEVLFHPENVFIVSKNVLKFLLLFHSHQIIFLMPVYTCYWVSIECIRRVSRWTIRINNVWEMLVVHANVFLVRPAKSKVIFPLHTQEMKQALKGFNKNTVTELPEKKMLNSPCVHQYSVTKRVYCMANKTLGKRDGFHSKKTRD